MRRSWRAWFGGAALLLALGPSGCTRSGRPIERRSAVAAQDDARFASGAFAYAKYCALCHGVNATGYAADQAPSLVSATFLESASDEFISRGIREGRPGTAMAPYGKARGGPLDDNEVAALIVFLRSSGPQRVPLPKGALVGDAARGENVYAASCKACHGTRAERGFAVHLANPALLSAASDAFLRHAVLRGRPGTPMPPFQSTLDETQINDVVATLRSWAVPQPRQQARREPPPLGEVVINPTGKAPDFKLRADRYVSIDDVKGALDAKRRMVLIDARAASDWLTMHITGSVSVPYYMLSRLDVMPRDGTWIIAYCACPHHASGAVVDELRKRGYKNTAVLDEGVYAWKKKGYPVASEPEPGPPEAAPTKPTKPVKP